MASWLVPLVGGLCGSGLCPGWWRTGGIGKLALRLRWLWDEMMETEHQVRIFPLTLPQGGSCQLLLTCSLSREGDKSQLLPGSSLASV